VSGARDQAESEDWGPRQQLCRYLQLNGVPAKPLTVGLDGRVTGEAVLAHAKALGCDLLIKGAYTQSGK